MTYIKVSPHKNQVNFPLAITTDCFQAQGRVLYETIYCVQGKDEHYIKEQ